MKIIKFLQFITEELNDTPEENISMLLKKIKSKIDTMFDFQEDDEDTDKVQTLDNIKRKSSDKMTFKDLGVRLESSEISKYSKLYDSLTVKFSDDSNTYALILMIDIKEAVPKDDKDFDIDDIKKCYIKFKKYDLDTLDILGQISKNVNVKDIDEDFLINLKIEIDDKFGEDTDEFKIETE